MLAERLQPEVAEHFADGHLSDGRWARIETVNQPLTDGLWPPESVAVPPEQRE
jgi:hypothetical protein